MENTKALEVVQQIERQFLIVLDDNDKSRACKYIQDALDEATSTLRTQLAERDAQLAALDMKHPDLRLAYNRGFANGKEFATRQPTQDKGGG